MNLKESLAKAGFTGKLFTHWMPWFGTPKHRDVGYQSWKPWVVRAQIAAIKNDGIEGVIATWSGDAVDVNGHQATIEMCYQCEAAQLGFMLLLNPPMVQYRADKNVTPNQEVMSRLLTSDAVFMLSSPAYYEKTILEFDMASQGVDVKGLQSAMPSYQFLSKHTGFTWLEKGSADGKLNALQNSLATMKANFQAAKIRVAGIGREFSDSGGADLNKSMWDQTRAATIIPANGGDAYYAQLDLIPKDVEVLAQITWNDYEEGSEEESRSAIRAGVRIG